MVQLGAADTDILLERRSMNTFQNAEFTEAILRQQRFDKLFLVTSGLHLPRALLYFSYFGIYPTPCAADYIVPQMSIFPIGYNFTIADLAAHEYIGMLRYYIYNFLGWNPTVFSVSLNIFTPIVLQLGSNLQKWPLPDSNRPKQP